MRWLYLGSTLRMRPTLTPLSFPLHSYRRRYIPGKERDRLLVSTVIWIISTWIVLVVFLFTSTSVHLCLPRVPRLLPVLPLKPNHLTVLPKLMLVLLSRTR